MTERTPAQTPRGRRPCEEAFTLIEVIVSLGVLGVSTMAIFGALNMCLRATQHGRLLTQSALLAERLAVRTRLSDTSTVGTSYGTEGPFRWRIQLEPTTLETLLALSVRVTWMEQNRKQTFTLDSLVRGAAPSGV